MMHRLCVAVATLLLAACSGDNHDGHGADHAGASDHSEHGAASDPRMPMEAGEEHADKMDHAGHGAMLPPEGSPEEILDIGTGRAEEIDVMGRGLMLDHGPLENIGMGAMTMYFDVAGDVDLTQVAQGAEVEFEVKRGRDGRYRIMRLCSDGPGCLEPREPNDR